MATKRTIEVYEVYDVCVKCERLLHSIAEGERGTCSTCWFADLKPGTHKAIKNLIAAAFNGSAESQKDKVVDDAFKAMRADEANRSQ